MMQTQEGCTSSRNLAHGHTTTFGPIDYFGRLMRSSLVPNFHDIPIWEPCHESLESNGHQIRTYAFQVFAARVASRLASRSLDLFTYVSASPLVSYLSISSCNLVHSSFNSAIIYPKNLSLAAVNVRFLGDYLPCRCRRTTPHLYGHLPGSGKILPKHKNGWEMKPQTPLHKPYAVNS